MQATSHDSLSSSASRPHILLRSSWQTVNIGDIAHTPGVLSLLEKHLPEAKITLWPRNIDNGVRDLLRGEFPQVAIAEGEVVDGQFTTEALKKAFDEADFLLHGSGPHLVSESELHCWKLMTGKRYGVYGVTIDPLATNPNDPDLPSEGASLAVQWKQVSELGPAHLSVSERKALNEADFVFCRDRLTLDYLKRQQLTDTRLGFAPDGAFGIESRNDRLALAFLKAHALEPGRFMCAIPRLRYTPYHLIHKVAASRRDRLRAELSDSHRERDMAKFREIIIQWVRQTGLNVLLCPEMTYQIDVAKESVYDLLPKDVKPLVVCRMTYWFPDEACSTYAMAHTVLSMDNHSPIFTLAMGVPTVFMRHPTDTIKGQMWPDVGMGDWFFETDEAEAADVLRSLLAIHRDREAALLRVKVLMDRVHQAQADSMKVLRQSLTQVCAELTTRA